MGGSIAVTARRANGEIFRMCRWTNPLPEFFQDVRWIDGDETHLDEYLKQWFEMRADYEKNGKLPEPDVEAEGWGKWADQFEFNMTSVYAPHPYLAPHGYGLVVIDYQTKTLLTLQGYSALITIFSNDFEMERHPAMTDSDYSEDQVRLLRLLERGCVGVLPRKAKDFNEARKVPDLETAQKLLAGSERPYFDYKFFIDPEPWTVQPFPETAVGVHEMQQAVEKLGFKLTDNERVLWDEFERQWEAD